MNIRIEIQTDGAAFANDLTGELQRVLGTIPGKVIEQLSRAKGCVCTAPEAADVLRDVYGNRIGSLSVESSS